MDQYLQNLEIFYDEKMKFLTKKDKYIKCSDCEQEKQFSEKKDKLVLSCGKDDGNCGPQIIIEIPQYIHYERKIKQLQDELINEYNWESLKNYLDVSKEYNDATKKQKIINEEILRIEKLFFEKIWKKNKNLYKSFMIKE